MYFHFHHTGDGEAGQDELIGAADAWRLNKKSSLL